MIIDADEVDVEHIYKLLITTIVPRAIGWISTLSARMDATMSSRKTSFACGISPI